MNSPEELKDKSLSSPEYGDINKYLNILFQELESEYIEVRFLGGSLALSPKFYSSTSKLIEEYPTLINLPCNVYVGVCPRRERKGDKKSVSRIRCLWLDLDAKTFSGGKGEILKRLQEFMVKTTMIIDSGNGYHAYWALKEPETNQELIEVYLRSLASVLGADKSVCEVAHILRPPKSFNRKDPSKPLLVQAVSIHESLSYNLSDFDIFLQKEEKANTQFVSKSKDWMVDALSGLAEGNRNATFASIVGRLLRDGHSSDEIYALLLPHAEKCRFPAGELRGEIDGISKRYSKPTIKLLAPPSDSRNQWPDSMKPAAYYGLVGDLVRIIEPHSESDPVALLSMMIVGIGNMIGRGPHLLVEATRHYLNLFVVVVGASSRARKGTAWGHVEMICSRLDANWAKNCINKGLASGEGLIWSVRDPIYKLRKKKSGEYEEVMEDKGVDDKRVLVIEEEFSSPLKLMQREGNILSPTLRCAWDKGSFQSLTKNTPVKATDAHPSVIGHVTKDELLRCFDKTEAANGFGNRILWLCTKRSKELPDGGCVPEEELAPILLDLAEAVNWARTVQALKRDEEARKLWHEVYSELTRDTPGLLGAVISRAEAQVSRLSCFYALLDKSPVIRVVHLRAALAFWDYAEQSARHIFGDRLGYPEADEILQALRTNPQGLTRTQIQQLFQRNKTAEHIQKALEFLHHNQFAEKIIEETSGRPAERWVVKGVSTNETK